MRVTAEGPNAHCVLINSHYLLCLLLILTKLGDDISWKTNSINQLTVSGSAKCQFVCDCDARVYICALNRKLTITVQQHERENLHLTFINAM